MANPLPSFQKPPVVETILGVEFHPINTLHLGHFGLFWQQVRSEFPRFEVQTPLSSNIETFDQPAKGANSSIAFLDKPEVRCWFLSGDDHRLMQVQRERFLSNWRKYGTDAEYPRYEKSVRPAFEKNWSEFNRFLRQEKLGEPELRQCEVTYINHIPKGEGWESFDELGEVFNFYRDHWAHQFLPEAEAGAVKLRFQMPNQAGRLHVAVNSAVSPSGELITFNLTARGKPSSSSLQDITEWFDSGREWVVRGFADLTTDKMHKLWERQH